MDFMEISAKTVDEAITKAAIEMGVPSDQLEIQVISEGSSGFLGLGSKPAVIQVRRIETEEEILPEAEAASPAEEIPAEEPAEEKAPREKKENRRKKDSRRKEKKHAEEAPEEEAKPDEAHQERRVIVERTEEEVAVIKEAAVKFLTGVFTSMELPVNITTDYIQEEGELDVTFEGEDMGILIGKRGQTLDSLQYLVSLVVNKDQKNYIRVKLDTEDYRRRRKETLENLAKNIANKVKRNHRSVSLEAMNPYERRIIHSSLQGNRYVETHSEGNEPYRHVVVTPKKGFRD